MRAKTMPRMPARTPAGPTGGKTRITPKRKPPMFVAAPVAGTPPMPKMRQKSNPSPKRKSSGPRAT